MTGRPSWETRGNFNWNEDEEEPDRWWEGSPFSPDEPTPEPPPASPWEVLELDPNTATLADVKAAYKTRAKATHPDRVPVDMDAEIRDQAETRFKQVRAAYDAILEAVERYGDDDG
jgi:hypothetical protein